MSDQIDLRITDTMQRCPIDEEPRLDITVCKCYKSHPDKPCYHLRDGWHCDCIER